MPNKITRRPRHHRRVRNSRRKNMYLGRSRKSAHGGHNISDYHLDSDGFTIVANDPTNKVNVAWANHITKDSYYSDRNSLYKQIQRRDQPKISHGNSQEDIDKGFDAIFGIKP